MTKMTLCHSFRVGLLVGGLLAAQSIAAQGHMFEIYFSSLGPTDIDAKVENAVDVLSLGSGFVLEDYELATSDVEHLSKSRLLSREQARRLQRAIIEGLGSPRSSRGIPLTSNAARALWRVSYDAFEDYDDRAAFGVHYLNSPHDKWRELAFSALVELDSRVARQALERSVENGTTDTIGMQKELLRRADQRREMFEAPDSERTAIVEEHLVDLLRTATQANRSTWAPSLLDLIRVLENTPGEESTKLLRQLWNPGAFLDAARVESGEVRQLSAPYLKAASQGSLLRRGDLRPDDPGILKMEFTY